MAPRPLPQSWSSKPASEGSLDVLGSKCEKGEEIWYIKEQEPPPSMSLAAAATKGKKQPQQQQQQARTSRKLVIPI